MMTSLAQSHSPYPGGIQQHPGIPQGHPMAGVPHNPGQQMQGQPGMNPQMHMGVSGPGGPQVSQAGALMGGMPPGAGGPSAHALQHLNPGQAQQAQMYQQQQMFASNPQLQQMQQQQMIQQHRQQQAARQALMAQQYSGAMPGVGMPNGMNQMSQAQYAAMRQGNPMARPVNLPQHLQQAQQQAQHSLEQQQAQQQHQHQQHLLQQMQLQQQAQAQAGNNQGQPQMNPQQIQNMQAQMAAQQQQHAQAQAQAQAAAAAQQQQNQAQSQPQPQPQQSQPNPQAQPQQPQPQQQQQPNMQQQQQQAAAMAAMQQQQRQGEKLKGQCLMKLMQFGDHLSSFSISSKPLGVYIATGAQIKAAQATKLREDLNYWLRFVDQFFSAKGVLRHSVWDLTDESNKQYEIPFHALARYFHTHFESGIKNIQMIMERGSEKELPNNGHFIESLKSSFVYWFDSGSHLTANGTLRAHFDGDQKIELFEFVTSSHEEYLPITRVVEAARPLHEWNKEWKSLNLIDGKQSPEINKKKTKAMKSPQNPPPEIDLPPSKVKKTMGITPMVFRFLELAEVIGQMNPLFNYSHQNSNLAPYTALDQYIATQTMNGNNLNGQQPSGPRTPGMSNFPIGASPAAAHLQLPDGSPHVTGSPAQAPGMQLQQSQHGTSSSGPSANTSPNVSNKRRRPSAVKVDDENQVNGAGNNKTSVKPSPRITKRQKGNPA